jgi:hypothetical protein
MCPDRRILWLLLIVLAVAPYLTGLHHAWVYDDHGVIVENEFLSDASAWSRLLTLDTIRDAEVIDGQRPVVVASYLIDRAVWGIVPAGFRTTNIVLHLIASLLVFHLLLRLASASTVAGWAAVLFAVHPLAVEAVVSPAFREDLLYLVFGLAFLLAWLTPRVSIPRGVWGLCALALAVLSKEAAVVFPVLLIFGWWWYPNLRPLRATMSACLVGSLVIAGGLLFVMMAGRPVQAIGGIWNGLSFRGTEGWWSAPWMAVLLLAKLTAPFSLSVDYVVLPVSGLSDPRFWLAWCVLGILGVLVVRDRRHSVTKMTIAWMLILFLPVSNLLPLYNPTADRYAYAMIPGFTWLLASGVQRIHSRGWVVLVLVAGLWAGQTWSRLSDWKDDRTLWTAAMAVEPRSARAHTWLGLLEKEEGRLEEAWNLFLQAEALNPHDVTPIVNRAIMMGEAGELSGAETLLREALFIRPNHKPARQNLEECLRLQGK